MNLTMLVAFAAAVLLVIVLRRWGLVSAQAAREHLKQGALIIDVRTAGEFAGGHLANAVNLPLDQIETALPRRVSDKDTVLLLHCQSGMRSGVAKRKLRGEGYKNVFNLGSLARARSIVGEH